MSRATLVYILMMGLCAAGLWAILGIGPTLKAPPDLSGTWEILPDDDPAAAGATDNAAGRLGRGMVVEQSGRYFEIRFANGQVLDLKSTDRDPPARSGGHVTVHLAGDAWQLAARMEKAQRTSSKEPQVQSGAVLLVEMKRGPSTCLFVAWRPDAEPASPPVPPIAPRPPATSPSMPAGAAAIPIPPPHAS